MRNDPSEVKKINITPGNKYHQGEKPEKATKHPVTESSMSTKIKIYFSFSMKKAG